MPELPKAHYSFPLRADWLDPVHPFLPEYVRITHSAAIGPDHTERQVKNALALCRQANDGKPKIAASLAVNYSPYHYYKPGSNDFGQAYEEELAKLEGTFDRISRWMSEFNQSGSPVGVGAVLLDCERYDFRASNSAETNAAIVRKYDEVYTRAKKYFPHAVVEWYRRGDVREVERPPDFRVSWVENERFSGQERGDAYSCQLYRANEIGYERETLERTAKRAAERRLPVNVWLALGAGYRRDIGAAGGERFDLNWDYDEAYSWLIGLELNRQPDLPQAVIFYPAAFDPRVKHWGKHFTAYVNGAARIRPSAS